MGNGEVAMNEGSARICQIVVGRSMKAGLMWMTNKVGSWTVEVWNLLSIFHTVPILHQVIITCFSTSRSFWLPSLRIDQETKDVHDWLRGLVAGNLSWWRHTKAVPSMTSVIITS